MGQEANHITSAIADLRAWRDQIDNAIQTLEHFNAKGLALPSSGPPGVARSHHGDIPGDAFFQMTVPDAAEKYLKLVKATKEIPEIAEALLKGGLKSSSKNFTDMTRTVMSRDERFVKVPSGDWGLTEWYPAMRKEKKPKATTVTPKQASPSSETPIEAPLPTTTGADAATKILIAMNGNLLEEWTATKLAEETGLKIKTVQGTVFRLRHEGKITNRTGGKGYVVVR